MLDFWRPEENEDEFRSNAMKEYLEEYSSTKKDFSKLFFKDLINREKDDFI